VSRDPAEPVSIQQRPSAAPIASQQILTDEVQAVIADVLENGFLASQCILAPDPVMTAFLPIAVARRQERVMLIGHNTADPLPKQLLDIYLAIAGLAGATSERLKNERDLIKHRAELEKRVKERTAELARSNSDLEQFAYVASHDLQEPLRGVSGFMTLLKREFGDTLDPNAREYVDLSIDSAKRMQSLIRDLLEFSRVGTRGQERAKVDLAAALEHARKNLSVAIDEANAVITYETMPIVSADAGEIVKLFQDLIENAIKFRGQRRPEVVIGAKKRRNEWEISIRDNGIGIEKQNFDRIFLLFQRLHSRVQYEGTGVGLAICKKIVERHGGRIWIESEVGVGTTIYFTIPQ
jgi:light-regulated signal transduction histidine kinase (bacteriophytochrome)